MKKVFLFIALVITTVGASAQSDKYIAAMKKNLAAIDSSFRNPANLLTLANSFERIAIAEKNQWLPYYYAAFCQVNYGFMEADKEKTDGIADKATELINKADSLMPNNSEISCIKSMIASCHMMTFLFLASRAGYLVTSYDDDAVGHMVKNEHGRYWVNEVLLRPRIAWGGDKGAPDAAELDLWLTRVLTIQRLPELFA